MDDTSFKLFKLTTAGFCCTQMMLKMALNEEGIDNPDLIRASNGLCQGIGGLQKTCGVLIGGIQIIGLYTGKGIDTEFAKPEFSEMIQEWIEWFEAAFESTECVDLIGITSFEDPKNGDYQMKCGEILSNGYEQIRILLENHGYELGNRGEA
ncbi:MAG: hypothetical protein PWQ12_1645 [Clostridiales bacterium]|jgi:C_GCAxxG_C_C family probable redox protein|nr:hypothetical protein [Clostridiales bacterium]